MSEAFHLILTYCVLFVRSLYKKITLILYYNKKKWLAKISKKIEN